MPREAGEPAGSFPTAAVAAEIVVHQYFLTPCKTSFAPPRFVACGGEASWPTVAPESAAAAAAHCCCRKHKGTSPFFFLAPDSRLGSTQQETERPVPAGHVAGGVSWRPFVHLSARSS